ncbi:hypothetical protein [Goekera deserti]|uniref:hypothetical protein n=1 Tax=Goekera deserti TaxID=2497753 RepID=UPI001F34865D|nr:hypothetical protein [Goekera deserti]
MSLIGFLVLTGLVILLGTHSTARYEQERQAASTGRPQRARTVAGESIGATAIL